MRLQDFVRSRIPPTISELMKSTKVQNPRRILHILRSMAMRVHRACAGFGQKLYACVLFIMKSTKVQNPRRILHILR